MVALTEGPMKIVLSAAALLSLVPVAAHAELHATATIDVTNISGASLSEAIVLRFTLLKSVTA